MLTLRGVSLVREGNRLLSDIDLSIVQGERLVILGPNGAGKTLLMHLAHRLLRPTQGEVLDDAGPTRQTMVFQRAVLLRRSVIANVLYAIEHARLPPAAAAGRQLDRDESSWDESRCGESRPARLARAHAALRLVGLEALAHRPARVLSGGEQQRVALARAAALRPDLVWFDEPTANLDPASTQAIEAIVMQMSRAGTTCVMSTHDIGQARRLAQRVLLMAAGRIIEATPAERFFDEPATESGRRYLKGELLNG
jgi:tungstate transport system ATP-binding protein